MKNKKLKGSVLVFSLIVLFIILAVAVGISSVTLVERKTSGVTGKSTQAFQVADSGAEIIMKALSDAEIGGVDQTIGSVLSCNDSSGKATVTGSDPGGRNYQVTFYPEGEDVPEIASCGAEIREIRRIKSVGLSEGTTRAVDVPFKLCDAPNPDDYTSLIMYYKFEESNKNSGSSIMDDSTSGDDNGGTYVQNSTDFDNGVCSKATKFNDGLNHADTPNTASLNTNLGTGSFTLAAWVKTDDCSEDNYIFDDFDSGSNTGFFVNIMNGTCGSGNAGKIEFGIEDGSSDFTFNGDSYISDGAWHFVVAVFDRDNDEAYIYIDGFSDTSSPEDISGSGSLVTAITTWVGGGERTSTNGFSGVMDEVMIFNEALSDTDISELYNRMKN